ncbi:PRC-barrel domain-containing protein [Novosphingobium sp. PhB55]|uniref:PRC-barrel domain-containing protein n=1 Tax=unclassified Novosphingobium TaxID=2644732 RepID=UPI0010663DEB|nr:PRC-barrel domain-containing protein [Novosphingobium sp. PhB55]TDW58914.1 PRC-barrel domain protein [Novosphingobium sp. PhB55]
MTEIPAVTPMLVEADTTGLKVRSRDGDNLGHIKAFMVDKRSGQSTYAVLSLGGFLGFNKSFYPVPFSVLAYDATDDDYIVTIDRRVLEGGPSWANNAPEFNQAYADRVSSYYGTAPGPIA